MRVGKLLKVLAGNDMRISKLWQIISSFFKTEGEASAYMNLFTKILLVFLLIFFAWMFLAPINSNIIASGEIIISSDKKLLQHLEGGIIKEIKVAEGEFVQKEQELVLLDTTQIETQIVQANEGIKASEFQKTATIKLISTLKQEIKLVNQLLKKKNTSLTRKLDLQKQLNESEAKLGEIDSNLASLKSENSMNHDILKRSIIKAPVSGFVMDLKQHTIGGVITPGGEVMYIVPKDEKLIAEVKVKPQDIDLLEKELLAKVQLSAFKARLVPKLDGTVISVSADSFKEEMTGEVYFKARIEIPESELDKLKEDIKLSPGMPVDVFIITGSRTMFSYLITPIKESAYRAFREG